MRRFWYVVATLLMVPLFASGCSVRGPNRGPNRGPGTDHPFASEPEYKAAEAQFMRELAESKSIRYVNATVGELKDGQAGWTVPLWLKAPEARQVVPGKGARGSMVASNSLSIERNESLDRDEVLVERHSNSYLATIFMGGCPSSSPFVNLSVQPEEPATYVRMPYEVVKMGQCLAYP